MFNESQKKNLKITLSTNKAIAITKLARSILSFLETAPTVNYFCCAYIKDCALLNASCNSCTSD